MEFEQLVDTYADYLLKLSSIYTKDEQLMEEIVQASITRYEKQKNEQSEDDTRRTLAAITIKTAKAYVKYKQNKHKGLSTYKTESVLLELLHRLKAEERVLLFLYFYDEMSFREISEVLNISISIIQIKLPKAQKKFLSKLRNDNEYATYETMFKRELDKEFGSTYAARRRIKQHLYQEQDIKVKDRQPPKVFSISMIVALIFALTLSIPFQYHRHLHLPHFNEDVFEWNTYLYSMYLGWNDDISTLKLDLFNHLMHIATLKQFMAEEEIKLPESALYKEQYDQYVADLKTYYSEDLYTKAILNGLKEEFHVEQEYFVETITEDYLLEMQMYELLTPKQDEKFREFQITYEEEQKKAIDRMKERYEIEDVPEEYEPLPENVQFAFGNSLKNYFLVTEDDTIVYKNFYTNEGTLTTKYEPYIMQLQEELDLLFIPLHFKEFYDYVMVKANEGNKQAGGLAQLIQVLSNTYNKQFPGWIDPVPPLSLKDIEV